MAAPRFQNTTQGERERDGKGVCQSRLTEGGTKGWNPTALCKRAEKCQTSTVLSNCGSQTWGREGGGEHTHTPSITKEESVPCRYGFLEDLDCRKVAVIGSSAMPLSNIHRIFGGLHSWPARRLHIDSPDFSSAGRASCSPSTAAVLDTKMAAVRILEGTQSAGFLLSCSRANCWAPTASTSGAPCVRLGNATRKLMRLLSQKANGIHVNLCLWPISALASWRSGSLCLGMKRKRASMSSPPCKSVHPPLILHFSLKALLGLPTPTEMPSISRRPAQGGAAAAYRQPLGECVQIEGAIFIYFLCAWGPAYMYLYQKLFCFSINSSL